MPNFNEGFPNPVDNIPVNNNENKDIDLENNIEEGVEEGVNKDANKTTKESLVDRVKKGGRKAVVYGMLGLAGVGAIKGSVSAEENFGKSDDPKTEKIENNFSTWMTAKTGGYGPGEHSDIIKNLSESMVRLNLDLEGIRSVELDEKQKLLQFVKITPKELGLSKGAKYEDLIAAAKKNNLVLVPAEGVLYLLLQNTIKKDTSVEKPGDKIIVLMNPIEYDEKEIIKEPLYRTSTNVIRYKGSTEETGKHMSKVFVINSGGPSEKDLTELSDMDAPKNNNLVKLDQVYLALKASAPTSK